VGVYAEFYCPECGFRVRTGGPEEFYHDSAGRARHYGHPQPRSEEARAAGVHGFFAHMWCPGCREIKHVTVAQFDVPLAPHTAWERLADLAEQDEPAVCPDCGRELGSCIFTGCPRCDCELHAAIVKT
jgi:hypothetical protein